MKKTTIATALGIAIGGGAMGTANAVLTSSATLDFSLGTAQTTACKYGTTPPCALKAYNLTDIVGSYFSMDTNGDGIVSPFEKTPISSNNGLHFGTAQGASGSHAGSINGTESPNIDNPWEFFGGTGMHQTLSPTVDNGDGTIDLNWDVTWNGIPSIPLNATSTTNLTCLNGDLSTTCSDSSAYTIDGSFHVAGAGFTTVGYTVNLTGHVSVSAIPVPAAVWLFGSGLLGLAGVARRRKSA